jgi:hypothetical protein
VVKAPIRGGSRLGRARNIERHRLEMHERMIQDYFCDIPVLDPTLSRRCYRMCHSLLLTIMVRVCARDNYFKQKRGVAGLLELSPHQKITLASWHCGCFVTGFVEMPRTNTAEPMRV